MNEFWGIEYMQGDQKYISTILPMKYILDNYTVLVYGENTDRGEDPIYGYQRSPKPVHFNKIAKEILKDINSQVTPNSIILGINKDDIMKNFEIKKVKSENEVQIVTLTSKSSTLKIKFRVIDGQHRIKGFEKALSNAETSEQKHKLETYNANVIIMLLKPEWRSPEVKVFSDINSKAKPLKMDLTKLAEYKYALKEEPSVINIENYVIVSVIRNLNGGEMCKFWKNGIILDVNAQKPLGCVGFKAFYDSIAPLSKKYISKFKIESEGNRNFIEQKKILDNKAMEISEILASSWNLVFKKWPAVKNRTEYDNDENVEVYYDNNYYLQRTMGVIAINHIITKCYINQDEFSTIITKSKLSLEDWKQDGKFTGLSSMSGVYKIEKSIENQE